MKIPEKKNVSFLVFLALSIVLLACTYVYQEAHPPCCDADNYRDMAKYLSEGGILSKTPHSQLRTYFFPAFLSLSQSIFDALGLPFFIGFFLLQIGIFSVAVVYFWKGASPLIPETYHRALLFGIVGFWFVFPFFSVPLTESLSATFFIALAGSLFRLFSPTCRYPKMMLFFGGIFAGAALMVRPANIILIPILAAALALSSWKHLELRSKILHAVLSAIVVSIGFFASSGPQIFINMKYYNEATVFPTMKIGDLQIEYGKQLIKYGTRIQKGEGGLPLYYPNPFLEGSTPAPGLSWYLENPGRGILTLAGHLFAAVDTDDIFTYMYDLSPWYRWLLFLYSHVLLVSGVLFLARLWSRRTTNGKGLIRDFIETGTGNFFLLSAVFLLSWASVHAFSAPENRFALPVYAFITPLAFLFFGDIQKNGSPSRKVLLVVSLYFILAFLLSRELEAIKQASLL